MLGLLMFENSVLFLITRQQPRLTRTDTLSPYTTLFRSVIAFSTAMPRDVVKLTNGSWILRPDMLAGEWGLAALRLINDFEAVAHAISKLPAENLQLLFGEDRPFPENGAVTILGPGTGLGVAMIAYEDGVPHVVAHEEIGRASVRERVCQDG